MHFGQIFKVSPAPLLLRRRHPNCLFFIVICWNSKQTPPAHIFLILVAKLFISLTARGSSSSVRLDNEVNRNMFCTFRRQSVWSFLHNFTLLGQLVIALATIIELFVVNLTLSSSFSWSLTGSCFRSLRKTLNQLHGAVTNLFSVNTPREKSI